MKKTIITRMLVLTLILSINLVGFAQKIPSNVISISQSEDNITLTFNLPTYTLKDTSIFEPYGIAEIFKYIDIDYLFGIIDDIGYPQLPQLTVDLSIPHGAYDFQVSLSNIITQDVTLNRKILPTQEDFEENPNFQMDSSYYNSTGSLYDFPFQLSEPFIVFDENGISFSIFPFTYNPQMNMIAILSQATFTISYSISELKSDKTSYSSQVRESYLSGFFENYINQKNDTDLKGRYLMITAPVYESMLASFANYKRNLGYEVNVVNTNITGGSANNIKSYIQNQYNNIATRPDFVLLIGDHADIPASGGNPSGNEKNDPITDLHYARLAGDDYFADVFLGRFSVSSPTHLQNLIDKTTYMEMNIHKFEKKAKFLAGAHEGWNSGWMEKQFEKGHDYVIKNTFNPQDYNSQKLYQPSTSSAICAISDNPIYYIYSGHGGFTYIAGVSFTLSASSLTSATNTVFPFAFSFACFTGNFAHSSPCFGEHWTRAQKGGVAYFGSSVKTKTNSDKAIEKKIFGDAFTENDHIAAITNLGMKGYWQRFWSLMNRTKTKRYMKAYNLLGDPSLNKNGVQVLTMPVVCGPTTASLKNPTHIPVTWSVTGDYSLSDQTDTSVVVTRTGYNCGSITAEFEGLSSVTESIIVCDLTIIGPSIVCNVNTTFSLNNFPSNFFVTWTKSGNLTYVSGQDSANYTVKATGPTTNGEGWVEAAISGPGGTVVARKDVWVGIPKKPSHIVFVPHTPCTNQFVLAYFNEINPPISQVYYQWSSGDHVFFPQGESSTWFQTKGPLSYTTNVHVSAQNICGSNILTQLLTVQECGGGGIPPVPPASDPETPLMVISPNPAGDYIDVFINNDNQQLQGNEVYVMTIYDRFSQVVRNVTTDVPHVRIPVYNLPTGTYVLSVVSGDQVKLHGIFIIQR